jgi:hypothetical protein
MCIPSHAALLAPGEHRAFADLMAPAAPAPTPPRPTTSRAIVPTSNNATTRKSVARKSSKSFTAEVEKEIAGVIKQAAR